MPLIETPIIPTFDKGTTVLIEIEFKKQTPFGALTYFDPVSPTVDVIDPYGTTVVNGDALTQSDTGKWYYLCQTTEASWPSGKYTVKTDPTDSLYTGMEETDPGQEQGFELV